MKNLPRILGLAAAVAMTSAATASKAADYQIFYIAETEDYTVAGGQIDVGANGVASSGYLQVFTGPDVGNYTLVAGSGSDSGLAYDNQVNVSAFGFLDADGLLWSSTGSAGSLSELDLAFNSTAQGNAPADTFTLTAPGKGGLESFGIATLTPMEVVQNNFVRANTVADSGSTVALLGAGLGGLAALRRRFRR